MTDHDSGVVTIGQPSRARARAAAGVLIGGAILLCGTTLAGFPMYRNLLVLGAIVTLAWLVDGTSRRYLGAGVSSLAVGLGLTLGADAGAHAAEHGIVYPLLGVGLLLVWRFNKSEVLGAAGFLIIVGATVWSFQLGLSYNGGYWLAVILAVWGAVRLASDRRTAPAAPAESTVEQGVNVR